MYMQLLTLLNNSALCPPSLIPQIITFIVEGRELVQKATDYWSTLAPEVVDAELQRLCDGIQALPDVSEHAQLLAGLEAFRSVYSSTRDPNAAVSSVLSIGPDDAAAAMDTIGVHECPACGADNEIADSVGVGRCAKCDYVLFDRAVADQPST